MIKHLTTKDIITSKRINTRTEERNQYTYTLDDKFIKYHIELNSYSNRNYKKLRYGYYQTVFIRSS